MAKENSAGSIQAKIRNILLRDWDPIGISDEPACLNEYDGYVGRVYRLIVSGGDEDQLASHLAEIEAEQMGLSRPPVDALLPVARMLIETVEGLTRGNGR